MSDRSSLGIFNYKFHVENSITCQKAHKWQRLSVYFYWRHKTFTRYQRQELLVSRPLLATPIGLPMVSPWWRACNVATSNRYILTCCWQNSAVWCSGDSWHCCSMTEADRLVISAVLQLPSGHGEQPHQNLLLQQEHLKENNHIFLLRRLYQHLFSQNQRRICSSVCSEQHDCK